MTKRKPIIVDGITFKSQDALLAHVKAIEARYPATDVMSSKSELLTGADFAFVRDLLNRHPFATAIIGPGIKSLWMDSDGGSYRNFYYERVDGTTGYFGRNKCVRPFEGSPEATFNDACRLAVVDALHNEKERFFGDREVATCPIRRVEITRETSHVDHVAPWTFRRLVEIYVSSWGLDVRQVQYVYTRGGFNRTCFADRQFEADFVDWHNLICSLQVVSIAANLNECREKKR